MSYFDYFRKNIAKNDGPEFDQIQGTCYLMCPEEEIKLREQAKMVHLLEVFGNEKKLVKSYSRSAADSNMAVPRLLRPYSVLMHTVQYLILEVAKREDVPQSVVYDFVNDRLRAVRQDMTIQRLSPEECVQLLDPMVRFYVYYGYILSNLPLKDYDPVLNKKYLLECIKWCLSCYDNITDKPNKDVVERLTKLLNKMDVNKSNEQMLGCDRVLMESLYVLSNLDDIHPLYRYYRRPQELEREPQLKIAYEIAVANLEGNFIKVCRLMDKLCPLTYCATMSYLPSLQRRALQVLSHGYNNKRLTVPLAVITKWLKFSDQIEAQNTCKYYGLIAEGAGVRFDKTDFKMEPNLHKLKIQDIETKFNIKDILYIYTYTIKEL